MGKLIDYDQDDNNVIETLRLISEMDTDQIERLFEAFCFYVALCYAGNENIRIPYIGDIIINDTVVDFKPHKNLTKIVDQLNTSNKSGVIMDIDLVKMFQNRIKQNLKNNDSVQNIL